MRHLLNILYVTTQESYLAREGENVLLRHENQDKFRVPVHNLEGIVCFGLVGLSPALMGLCMERNVAISFLTLHGAFLGKIVGPVSGNVLLRRRQYRLADDAVAIARLASKFILAKLLNSRAVLNRVIRDHGQKVSADQVDAAAREISQCGQDLERCQNLDSLRGIEGDASRAYFGVFDHLILEGKSDFFFHERSRRPPRDRMNCLLSFLYTLLAHDVRSALETTGIDPAVGFLHRDRPGRPSLALDLMEELRPVLADRLALTLVNRRQISASGFVIQESGAVWMDNHTRKTVLTAWQERKQEEIRHPFLDEKMAVGLIPYAQALLLARHLRGDMDDYPPFIWR